MNDIREYLLSVPYQHQIDAFEVSKDRIAFAYFAQMGTGKSLMTIMCAIHLFLENKIEAVVIFAPKGVFRNWSDNEIPTHLSKTLPHEIAVWSCSSPKEERERLEKLNRPGKFLRFVVINIEALNSERSSDFLVKFMGKFSTLLVIDESTVCKNPKAKRTKIAINIGKHAKYRRICSGNPIPNGPLDLFSQAEFLQRGILGYENFFAFRNRFCVMQDQRFGSRSFKSIVGYRDKEVLQRIMRKFAFIIKKEDCLDLPPKVYQVIDVEMGPNQTKAYNSMVEDAYIKLGDKQVTAMMVITQLLRLHQIACGFLKPDDMDEVPFGEPNSRLETLIEVLHQAPGKVIIWANYRYNVKQILAEIKKEFGENSVVDYYGETSDDDRQAAKKLFQDPNSGVRFIVSNPDTGRFGNTWTQATTVVYYSNSYNLEAREQSEDRAHRIGQVGAIHEGQTSPSVLYVDLRVRGTVDDRIIKVLKNKKKLTDEIVASNWQWLVGSLVT